MYLENLLIFLSYLMKHRENYLAVVLSYSPLEFRNRTLHFPGHDVPFLRSCILLSSHIPSRLPVHQTEALQPLIDVDEQIVCPTAALVSEQTFPAMASSSNSARYKSRLKQRGGLR